MYLARILFGAKSGSKKRHGEMEDAIDEYLASSCKNGQIYGDYFCSCSNGYLIAFVHVARPNSLAKQHHSEWSASSLQTVVELFGQNPEWSILEDNVPKRFAPWERSKSFYLFTNAFDCTSPIRCADTGLPIPLYLLPITPQLREELYFWSLATIEHDKICLGCGELEIPAYKQLANPTSELSTTGRELCDEVTQATKKPTFYYLQRYWGRNSGEAKRLCPTCGSKWHTSVGSDDKQPFHHFHFRCKKCHLVSHRAVSYDDERHARIGEFKCKSDSTTN